MSSSTVHSGRQQQESINTQSAFRDLRFGNTLNILENDRQTQSYQDYQDKIRQYQKTIKGFVEQGILRETDLEKFQQVGTSVLYEARTGEMTKRPNIAVLEAVLAAAGNENFKNLSKQTKSEFLHTLYTMSRQVLGPWPEKHYRWLQEAVCTDNFENRTRIGRVVLQPASRTVNEGTATILSVSDWFTAYGKWGYSGREILHEMMTKN